MHPRCRAVQATLGVRMLVVVINKMDDPSIIEDGKWSKERFEECRDKLTPFLKTCANSSRPLSPYK